MSYRALGGFRFAAKSSRKHHRKSKKQSPGAARRADDLHSHKSSRGDRKGQYIYTRGSTKTPFAFGTRAQVSRGSANHTVSGLTRNALFVGEDGRVKSIKASAHGAAMFKANPAVQARAAAVSQAFAAARASGRKLTRADVNNIVATASYRG